MTYISLGKAGVETPPGQYSTFRKLRADDMASSRNPDADHSYYLPNVPSVQYFQEGGYAIHGTYWHDEFGSDQSQGCVNLTLTDAAYLFDLTKPAVAQGENEASDTGGATPVMIVD